MIGGLHEALNRAQADLPLKKGSGVDAYWWDLVEYDAP